MTDTRTILLAGTPIQVPALPLRINMKAYPLCRKLTNAGLATRYVEAFKNASALEVTDEELVDLAEIAFYGASAADPELTREAFEGWAITPPELIDSFFPVRLQTGGWVSAEPPAGTEDTQSGDEEAAPGQGEA